MEKNPDSGCTLNLPWDFVSGYSCRVYKHLSESIVSSLVMHLRLFSAYRFTLCRVLLSLLRHEITAFANPCPKRNLIATHGAVPSNPKNLQRLQMAFLCWWSLLLLFASKAPALPNTLSLNHLHPISLAQEPNGNNATAARMLKPLPLPLIHPFAHHCSPDLSTPRPFKPATLSSTASPTPP